MCLIKVKKFLSEVPYVGSIFKMKPMVSVVRMTGVIADSSQMRKAGISHQKFAKIIEKAFDVPDLKALALVISVKRAKHATGSVVQRKLISSANTVNSKHTNIFPIVQRRFHSSI